MTSKDITNLKELQVDKYIGIPYEVNGRNYESIDCWGIVHLIYKEELGIDLPSFVEDGMTISRTQELIAKYKEGWEPTQKVQAGDVVIFRILGIEAHIGLAISSEKFIHARNGHDSAIESFDSPKWRTRLVGSYKYSEKKSVVLNGIPHPLRTERITATIPAGKSILELQDWIIENYKIDESYKALLHVFVNGVRIPEEMKHCTILLEDDVVEYRVVAGKNENDWRRVATIGIIIASAGAAGAYGATVGAALGGGAAATAVGTALVGLGVTAVGFALLDAIAPIRPPSSNVGADPTNPGSAEQQLMVNGGANRATPYGAIPFVLGKARITPPLGANTYNLFKDQGKESYLRMLLVWGYGPLYVDESTLKIGELPISNYEGITQETLTRIAEPTSAELLAFNNLYGTDITQVASGVELTCDGTAGSTPVIPGPWLDAVSTDGAAGDFTVAVHFPQGCRRIIAKGETAGQSLASPVRLQIEYKLLSASTWTNIGVNYTVGSTAVKDAFTWTKSFTVNSSSENVQVRIRRITGTGNGVPADQNYQWLFVSTLVNTTFSRNTTPAIDPIDCKIAKTAFEIKASDQLNGQIEGINAICWTYGKSWNGTAWVDGNINNPAALFRHVLEHPANPRRVTDATNKINLTQIQHWHEYCTTKGFTFNSVVGSQRSVLDILRDICAAGRASPAMIDGKWTVIIDEPKTNIVQHFTPHNSWGFEGVKALPKIPDGLRVTFVNENDNYQEAETIVPAVGFTKDTAALLESISVPGVTTMAQAQDHARWHMAQANLRPEAYTLNTDIEYIVCNRGDRVKVMHDVPMWGLGSGRIKNISTNLLSYSEQFDNAAWNKRAGVAVTANQGIAPDDTITADLVEWSSGDGYMWVAQPLTANTTYTLSVYAKIISGSPTIEVKLWDGTANFTTGAIAVSGGWTRYTLTLTTSASVGGFDYGFYTVLGSVLLWGAQLEVGSTATDYIKTTATAASMYYLDEELPMQASTTYTMRVRGKSGITTVRNVVPKSTDAYYDRLEITTPATTAEIDTSDLFLFGELNQEAQDCLVVSIEPQNNKTARISLVDYGVTSTYNIFTDYLNYTNPIAFESQITIAPKLLIQSFGTKVPTITGVISDETVMQKIAAGVFAYNMQVSYTNAAELPSTVSSVEFQWDYDASIDIYGTRSKIVNYNLGSVTISEVEESAVMKVRARYVGADGRTGQWSAYTTHTIVGKTSPPSDVIGFTVSVDGVTGKLNLTWTNNTELDIKVYEVRTDTNWGNPTNLVFLGDATTCFAIPPAVGITTNYYIKAIDYSSNYSTTATTIDYTTDAVTNVTTASSTFYGTNKSSGYVVLDWNNVIPLFGLSGYEIVYGATTKFVASNTILITVDWVGLKSFLIKTVDTNGQRSTGYDLEVSVSLPEAPTSAVFSINQATVILDWNDANIGSLPIWGYEVRTDLAFGTGDHVFRGATSTCSLSSVNLLLGLNTFYIKSIDTADNYSSDYFTASYTVLAPTDVSSATHAFADTSLTAATITLDWNEVDPIFKLASYEITYDAVVKVIQANSIVLPANWIGERTFTIKTIDALGNKSSGYSKVVTKSLPDPCTNFRAQVIDNAVMFYWELPAVTTLPIDHVIIKKGATWETATSIGEKKGNFTTQNETSGGLYTYWVAAVDTDNNMSAPTSLIASVAQPPDFIFFADYTSDFTGTKSNATANSNVNTLLLPINTTETFADHFSTRSWASPQSQIDAGYPVYIQPSAGSGYYEETFDYGNILASSKISLEYQGTIIAAPISLSTTISISVDNSTWIDYSGVIEVFALTFRYVKVRVTATASAGTGIYSLESLKVRLDSKLLNDAGSVSCLSTDSLGTLVNFNKEFVDVSSITVSPQGTTAIIPVYDFIDSVTTATYSVTSNVCTVTQTAHNFITGQKLRISKSTGTGLSGVYTITGYTANTFTVAMLTADTSGNCSLYAESFRLYLFDTAGTRVSATASWSSRGY